MMSLEQWHHTGWVSEMDWVGKTSSTSSVNLWPLEPESGWVWPFEPRAELAFSSPGKISSKLLKWPTKKPKIDETRNTFASVGDWSGREVCCAVQPAELHSLLGQAKPSRQPSVFAIGKKGISPSWAFCLFFASSPSLRATSCVKPPTSAGLRTFGAEQKAHSTSGHTPVPPLDCRLGLKMGSVIPGSLPIPSLLQTPVCPCWLPRDARSLKLHHDKS